MKRLLKVLYAAACLAAMGVVAATAAGVGAYYYVAPTLPDVEALREVALQVPMRVYSRDGRLLAEFGEQRRIPVSATELPPRVVQAFLAAEDDRFFEHPGVDYQGLVRAAIVLISTGEKQQGGSTITMQLSRNVFLTREKTIERKVREIFLSLRIERELSKNEILTLYLNKIFLGQRAYGVGAAAEVYFGKRVDELTLAEVATIAGLPRAPSAENPVTNPEAARKRRAYVLRRMRELHFIDRDEFEQALNEPIESRLHGPTVEVDAPYVAEMARAEMLRRLGTRAYTDGFRVTTTIDSRLQKAANDAVHSALNSYDRRHGYRGPIETVPLESQAGPVPEAFLDTALRTVPTVGGLQPAIVRATQERSATARVRDLGDVEIGWDGLKWARPYINDNNVGPSPESAQDVVSPGDLVYLRRTDAGWTLAEVPAAQGAFVALDPFDGSIVALVGGYDYYTSKFNRATQAQRQPGSAFKPFIFSAALENGFTPASIVLDAPVVFDDPGLEKVWRPDNYSRRFRGEIRLREALVHSVNLVSIRVLDQIRARVGIHDTIAHLRRFGFEENFLPHDLSLALGSAGISPLKLAAAYAVFANGGFRTEPYFVESITDVDGRVVFEADPPVVCAECIDAREAREAAEAAEREREAALAAAAAEAGTEETPDSPVPVTAAAEPPAENDAEQPDPAAPVPTEDLFKAAERAITPQNAYLIADMMKDVVRRGTGVRARRELGREDLAGKTGTTNEYRDAWFSGFNGDLVGTAWVGFDQERSLGAGEEGAKAALPMWIAFMRDALDGAPEKWLATPPGLVTVRISPRTGRPASADDPDAIFELFPVGMVPEPDRHDPGQVSLNDLDTTEPDADDIF